jgi:hypothetical protein
LGSFTGGGVIVTADASGQQPASSPASNSATLAADRLGARPATAPTSITFAEFNLIVMRFPDAQQRQAYRSKSCAHRRRNMTTSAANGSKTRRGVNDGRRTPMVRNSIDALNILTPKKIRCHPIV